MPLPTLVLILAAVAIVSLVSFVGVFALFLHKRLEKILTYLISFAAGALLGVAFLDLLPESLEIFPNNKALLIALFGIIMFFTIEAFLHWHHHHTHKHEEPHHIHSVGYLNLFADGLHNFIDGMVIAAGFLISPHLGVVTTIAAILHEVPQEFGDFSILIYSGFKKTKALFFNFLSALTAVAGALFVYFWGSMFDSLNNYLIPFAAGGFIYIAAVDLLPELRQHESKEIMQSILQLILIVLGIFIIWAAGNYIKI